LAQVRGGAEDDDFRGLDERGFALTDERRFARFEGGPGFTKVEDQAGQDGGEESESGVLDQHGFEEDRDGVRLFDRP
jgi:hypothetical protein